MTNVSLYIAVPAAPAPYQEAVKILGRTVLVSHQLRMSFLYPHSSS